MDMARLGFDMLRQVPMCLKALWQGHSALSTNVRIASALT